MSAERARAGVWNENATAENLPDQHDFNLLLARLPAAEREIVAQMLSQEFVRGVHSALVVLHEHEVPPFEDGYEGTPFYDFMGRLNGWEWPKPPR